MTLEDTIPQATPIASKGSAILKMLKPEIKYFVGVFVAANVAMGITTAIELDKGVSEENIRWACSEIDKRYYPFFYNATYLGREAALYFHEEEPIILGPKFWDLPIQ